MASGTGPRTRIDASEKRSITGLLEPAAPQRAEGDAPAALAATLTAASAMTHVGAHLPPPQRVHAGSLIHLQRAAGNAAVAALVARRRAASRLTVHRKATLDEEWSGPAPEPDPNDVDTSEFTTDPRAAQELAKKPAPTLPKPPAAPAGPPRPVKPKALAKVKPTPKPPGGPRRKHGRKTKAKGKGTTGAIVKKPVPPPPPKYRFVPGMNAPEAAPLEARAPLNDPAFAKVAKAASLTVKKARRHPTGKQEGDAAQLAAKAPPNDKEAQAEAAHADTMAAAKPKEFSADDFYKAMKAALEQARPKNLKEATALESKAAGMQQAVKGTVDSSKSAAAADVKEKSEQAPDPSKATPKPEAPMTKTEIVQPGSVKASSAMPAPVPSAQIDFRGGPAKVDQEMADAEVTERDLEQSNEPEFTDALKSKKEAEAHADEAPRDVRKAEATILSKAATDAAAAEKTAVGGARSQITAAVTSVATGKDATKGKDEAARKEVADNINKIYASTKKDVDAILDGLDTRVEQTFDVEEARIRKAFTADWNRRLAAYKSRRYSGLRGKWRWVRDKFKGLPEAANKEYEASQKVYEANMDNLARKLSKLVAGELNAATRRIQQGRNEVTAYVKGLKGDLAKVGQEAAADLNDKFDDLDAGVKDKFDDLATSLGKKYAESEEAVKKEIEAAKEANKGLIDKAIDAVKGVIDTIRNLKDLLLNVLSKAAAVIGDILRNPIRFVRNLFSAIKGGIERFAGNILEHLKRGLMGWLFGTLGAANVEIPDSFDVKGMLKLVLSVLGLTWNTIRGIFVRKIGEPAMGALEKGSNLIQTVIKEGPVALWEMLREKFSDFEDMVLGKIKELIVEKVVMAGVTFLISMLNPASAFIKACKMIYDVIRFFMDNGSRIMELIHTIIDSIADVARGGVGGVPEKIENVLAKLLPMAIGFLASLVGMGGVGKKVGEIVDRVRKPMTKAVGQVVDTVTKLTKPIWGRVVNRGRKLYETGKAKYDAGRKYVENKVEAGKTWAKDKASGVKAKVAGLLKKPFSMNKEQHTLSVGGSGDIVMASSPERLSAKIGRAIGALKRAAAGGDASAAEREQALRAIGAEVGKLRRAAKEGRAASVLQGMLNAIAQALQGYAQRFKVNDLDAAPDQAVKKFDFLERDAELQQPVKDEFVKRLTAAAVHADSGPGMWAAMKRIVNGDPTAFLFKGRKLTAADLSGKGGTARVVDLRSVWDHMLVPAYKTGFARGFSQWVNLLRTNPGAFDPIAHIKPDATLGRPGQPSWWAPQSRAGSNTIGQIAKDLALEKDSWDRYKHGAVRFSIDAGKAAAIGFWKPTTLDGINFGQHFVPKVGSTNHNWGVTEQNVEEAVAECLTVKSATERTLIPPAAADAATADDAIRSGTTGDPTVMFRERVMAMLAKRPQLAAKLSNHAASIDALVGIYMKTGGGGENIAKHPGKYLAVATRAAAAELKTLMLASNDDQVVEIRILASTSSQRTPDFLVRYKGEKDFTRWEVRTLTGARHGYQQAHSGAPATVPTLDMVEAALRSKLSTSSSRRSQLDVPLAGVPVGGRLVVHLPRGDKATVEPLTEQAIKKLERFLATTTHAREIAFVLPGSTQIVYRRQGSDYVK